MEQQTVDSVAAPTVEETPKVGIGESEQEQAPVIQYSTVARERMIEIIANNKKVIEDSEKILALINADNSLDDSFCRLFGIRRNPGPVDVTGK